MKIKYFFLNVLISFWKKLNNLKIKSKILIIAGSDSSGGAGIQADIKTATCLGSYAMTAVTAVIVYTPRLAAVLISAWIPAPPDESDPAIIKIFDFIFKLFNFFQNNI